MHRFNLLVQPVIADSRRTLKIVPKRITSVLKMVSMACGSFMPITSSISVQKVDREVGMQNMLAWDRHLDQIVVEGWELADQKVVIFASGNFIFVRNVVQKDVGIAVKVMVSAIIVSVQETEVEVVVVVDTSVVSLSGPNQNEGVCEVDETVVVTTGKDDVDDDVWEAMRAVLPLLRAKAQPVNVDNDLSIKRGALSYDNQNKIVFFVFFRRKWVIIRDESYDSYGFIWR